MKLSTLTKFRLEELALPIRCWRGNTGAWPDSTPAHIAAHVIGAAYWYLKWWSITFIAFRAVSAAVGAPIPVPKLLLVVAVTCEAIDWQWDLEETYSTLAAYKVATPLPLWSMLWDIVTALLTAKALSYV